MQTHWQTSVYINTLRAAVDTVAHIICCPSILTSYTECRPPGCDPEWWRRCYQSLSGHTVRPVSTKSQSITGLCITAPRWQSAPQSCPNPSYIWFREAGCVKGFVALFTARQTHKPAREQVRGYSAWSWWPLTRPTSLSITQNYLSLGYITSAHPRCYIPSRHVLSVLLSACTFNHSHTHTLYVHILIHTARSATVVWNKFFNLLERVSGINNKIDVQK